MIAETISLGILSLPSVLAAVGIVPYVQIRNDPHALTDGASSGVILIVGLGIIATYTGYVIGQFKLAYPHVHNMCVHFGFILFNSVPQIEPTRLYLGAKVSFNPSNLLSNSAFLR